MAGSEVRALPYFKWYWQDWRANRFVQRMNYIERGLYRELLDECWAEGGIPDDIEQLAFICGCPEQVMADAWQVLGKCFEDSGNGLLVNRRLERERTGKDRERLAKAESGRKGGAAKALKIKENLASASNSQAKGSNCHIEEKSRVEDKTPLPPSDLAGAMPGKSPRSVDDTPYAEIMQAYQKICGGKFSGAEVLTAERKRNIKRTHAMKVRGGHPFREGGIEFWSKFFTRCTTNRHWCGENDRGWKASLEFITRESNVLKVLGV